MDPMDYILHNHPRSAAHYDPVHAPSGPWMPHPQPSPAYPWQTHGQGMPQSYPHHPLQPGVPIPGSDPFQLAPNGGLPPPVPGYHGGPPQDGFAAGPSQQSSTSRRSHPRARRSMSSRFMASDSGRDEDDELGRQFFLDHIIQNSAGLDASSMDQQSVDNVLVRQIQLVRGAVSSKMVASKMTLRSLQSVNINDLPEAERTCVICYNDYGVETPEGINEAPLRLPKCKHIFGDHCIKKWFEDSDSCPYCRDKLHAEPKQHGTSARAFMNMIGVGLLQVGDARHQMTRPSSNVEPGHATATQKLGDPVLRLGPSQWKSLHHPGLMETYLRACLGTETRQLTLLHQLTGERGQSFMTKAQVRSAPAHSAFSASNGGPIPVSASDRLGLIGVVQGVYGPGFWIMMKESVGSANLDDRPDALEADVETLRLIWEPYEILKQ
ncbi:hypothetical protein G7Z17_g13019 [Cylindrodendrum hubeiense]|uniref:RING-type domain-containing protein n=1 Tax=Cylindrodendrum hubeiense TaxID=595255 RepID=A0A9P5GXV4_9HYPO|nr:hypothetical protein G7Z17_g13019 [Cylindrodendrum hubeiense]